MRQRVAAIAALSIGGLSLALAIAIAIAGFPRGLTVAATLAAAGASAWYGLRRRGRRRQLGVAAAALLLAGALVLVAGEGRLVADAVVAAGLLAAFACAKTAFEVRAELPAAEPVSHAVLFYNPKSGGGKAERFHLADEARIRSVEAVELRRGDDLEALVRHAVADGADALAMAGGDGSQAIVADVAAELGLPYACIPAGTRNHFALDLGVDRDDVAGALDALVAGRERRVDLGDVNGQVFVNNVSLGLYADAVQRDGYREAKIRTLLDTLPDAIGAEASEQHLRWVDGEGRRHSGPALIVISNNPYRLARVIGGGTRPQLDSGRLGIAVTEFSANGRPHLQTWAADEFVVESDEPVWAGIDGESVKLEPPVRFTIRARVLRVWIAPHHSGAAPTAAVPDSPAAVVPALVGIARGHHRNGVAA